MNTALFVASRQTTPQGGQWAPVGKLEHGPEGYRFQYLRGARRRDFFQPFPEMPDLERVYDSEELFPLFANRLLARSRPEYEAYLTWGGFDPDHPPDPISLLSVTEGRRATDNLELFPCPHPDNDGCYVSRFFLHGMRYLPDASLQRAAELRVGESLGLMLDISNLHDPYAVAVRTCDDTARSMIGYAPRYLARDIFQLSLQCQPDFMSLTVARVNRAAPLQQRLLCQLNCCWPEGFRPCAGEDFQPIVTGQPVETR